MRRRIRRIKPVVHASFCNCPACQRRRNREKKEKQLLKDLRAWKETPEGKRALAKLKGKVCEICGEPAVYSDSEGTFCENCGDNIAAILKAAATPEGINQDRLVEEVNRLFAEVEA